MSVWINMRTDPEMSLIFSHPTWWDAFSYLQDLFLFWYISNSTTPKAIKPNYSKALDAQVDFQSRDVMIRTANAKILNKLYHQNSIAVSLIYHICAILSLHNLIVCLAFASKDCCCSSSTWGPKKCHCQWEGSSWGWAIWINHNKL